jgi:hypothetical protein
MSRDGKGACAMNGRETNEGAESRAKRCRLRRARNLVFECARERALTPREYAVAQGLVRRHAFNLN